ncbi:MAG TPA: hypothetical protein IAB77_06185 [Candidatus Scatomorpha intestinavium]|uniref:Uncharacterized protein n=1 Tax=Candidatus Scatomorpha intestinavium TaxID=2840922 RepID=A0A9D1CTW6_9FIRM|nr:hypothetical protein [Candidatus Scatomorpha intestinavium]
MYGEEGSEAYRKERVSRILREYFDECEREGRYPSEAGLMLRLGVGEEAYRELFEREDTAPMLERARLRRLDWLESRIAKGGAGITGLMNVLKREDAASAEEARLIIRMEGLGGTEAAK